MKMREFLEILRNDLNCLPAAELQKQMTYYEEILSDMIDDGMSEEEATVRIGDSHEVARLILKDMPPVASPMQPPKKADIGSATPWIIAVGIIGLPLWLCLAAAIIGIAVLVIVLAAAFIISLAALVIGLVLGGFSLFFAPFFMIGATVPVTILMVGIGFVLIGVGILTCMLFVITVRACMKLVRSIHNKKRRKEKGGSQ